MPQGLRGRVALFGAGILCCSGLVGCMTDHPTKSPPVSKAKAGTPTPPGAKTTVPDIVGAGGRPAGGSGIPTGGGFQPGTVTPAGAAATPPANPYNSGGIGGATVPGNYGPGAPLPGQTPNVPSLAPATSNYPPPAGAAVPPGYGSSNLPALPTARAAAPTQSPTPPIGMLTDLVPPSPPGGPLTAADTAPPTPPANVSGPLAPAYPFAPTASR